EAALRPRRRARAGGGAGAARLLPPEPAEHVHREADRADAGRRVRARAGAGGPGRAMRLLVLGGTVFVGRHIVEAATARGHEVTLFNRGRTAPELFPELERIVGDRTKELSALRGRQFDPAIDFPVYDPYVVLASV